MPPREDCKGLTRISHTRDNMLVNLRDPTGLAPVVKTIGSQMRSLITNNPARPRCRRGGAGSADGRGKQ